MKKISRQLTIEDVIKIMKKESTTPCYYCKINMCEDRCIYCTRCRLLMAEGKIFPNYGKNGICLSCKGELGEAHSSYTVCDNCISEL